MGLNYLSFELSRMLLKTEHFSVKMRKKSSLTCALYQPASSQKTWRVSGTWTCYQCRG